MRDAVQNQADLLAFSQAERTDLTYGSDQEMEKAQFQYVSGSLLPNFGLQPAAGRLFTPADDSRPGAHPQAVISHDYFVRRFHSDPATIGRKLRIGNTFYQIIGVIQPPFTGTGPGTITDLFIPTMMNPAAVRDDNTWHRIFARVHPGVPIEPLNAQLNSIFRAFSENRARNFKGMTKEALAAFLAPAVVLEPAAAGSSGLQRNYKTALLSLGVLVGLVLLIACANIANLMAAQAAARSREMALRVSIGAGRARLVQLVLVESALLAAISAALGACFAWWAAPFVVSHINPPDNPAQLNLPADWRVLAFAVLLTLLVTCLFGLAPALRASSTKPASALKGGSSPHSKRRLMHSLIAAQTAFCFVVLFVAGLFVTSFQRLSERPLGFNAENLLILDTVAQRPQPPVYWDQVATHLASLPGVSSVAQAGWPLLTNYAWNGFVSVQGATPGPEMAYFLSVTSGWLDTMQIRFSQGHDFRPNDTSPGAAVVNETFVKTYLPGIPPLGKTFAKGDDKYEIVGVVRDAPYRDLHETILPVAYVPRHSLNAEGALRPLGRSHFFVRVNGDNSLALASTLRAEISRLRPDFRVSNLRTQADLVNAQTIRERLLAMLSFFFACVALLLAAVGLYGVLDYSVLQRRREIGIRMAIGARPGDIAWRVTADALLMVSLGAAAGLALGIIAANSLGTLLYEVKPTGLPTLTAPTLAIFAAALLAAAPAVLRAVRIDPTAMLRSE
jgi:predicted permease